LHPFMLDIQYGAGLTWFLALYFKLLGGVSFVGLQILLRILTYIQYILVYFIAFRMYSSHKIAFLALLAAMVLSFYYMFDLYYYPSTGFLRFGFGYLILCCYMLEHRCISRSTSLFLICIIASISTIWSFESAFFTLSALFFTEYISKSLGKFIPIFIICFILVLLTYFYPFIIAGKWPLFSKYYEYVLLYTNAVGVMPLSWETSFWWLFPLVYVFILMNIITGKIKDRLVIFLTIYGMTIFLYFVNRAHPNNLFPVSIPFILLSIYIFVNIRNISVVAKQILLSIVLSIFFVSHYSDVITSLVGKGPKLIINGIVTKNIVLVKNAFISTDSFKKSINLAPRIDCSTYEPLVKYVENNSLAILYNDISLTADQNYDALFNVYECTHAHNAFRVNTYAEFVINPYAVKRALAAPISTTNKYILVDSDLINNKKYFDWYSLYVNGDGKFAEEIIWKLHAEKIDELKIKNKTLMIYKNPHSGI